MRKLEREQKNGSGKGEGLKGKRFLLSPALDTQSHHLHLSKRLKNEV